MKIHGISGRFGKNPAEGTKQWLERAIEMHGGPAGGGERIIDTDGFQAGYVAGEACEEGGVFCVVVGCLDWLDVDIADRQSKQGQAAALLYAYRRDGRALLDIIGGQFALVIWDRADQSGLLACDRFGRIPIYWSSEADAGVVFGPTTDSVRIQLQSQPDISEQAIFNYLYFHMVPSPGTIYEGISKLRAAHALVISRDRYETVRYWQPNFRETEDQPQREATQEMLGLLSSSVARLNTGPETGAFLSGGIDSSTVSGFLAQVQANPSTYSIGFQAEGYDEIAFAKIASSHFDTAFNSYYVEPTDVLEALPKIAAAYDEPFGNSSALPAYFCARLAAYDGKKLLLAGDGGDELFAGNERYAKQGIFEWYSEVPRLLRRQLIEPLARSLPKRSKLTTKARSYIDQANTPLPDRLQSYNLLNQLGLPDMISSNLWRHIDPMQVLDLERELYEAPDSASTLNRMLYLDWHHTLADNDLRKVTRMCQLAGIEVTYPMLDDRLVEFSTRVSSSRKMSRNQLRRFFKQSVTGFLPEAIINKKKQGFGLPFGVWLAEHPGLQELADDCLASFRARDIVPGPAIEKVLQLHRQHHAGYYGEFIWLLVFLELWLQAHHNKLVQ